MPVRAQPRFGAARAATAIPLISVPLCSRIRSTAQQESTEDTSEAVQRYSFADRALACVLEVFQELERSVALGAYENHQMIRQRLGPNFRVKMGYGLHAGWAIEGAIGSRHKVDPSYLSAHVNIASRLESATKQYGVPLLMSEAFVKRVVMEENIQGLRLIDRVTVKGSDLPMGIYVFDTKSITWKLPVRRRLRQPWLEPAQRLRCALWPLSSAKLAVFTLFADSPL